MAKRKFPDLDATARFYANDTQRPRLRSAGIEHYSPVRSRRGLYAVLALALAAAALLATLVAWLGS